VETGVEKSVASTAEDLLPQVYDELRRLAAHRLSGEPNERTLQPTALVHEAWVRMTAGGNRAWMNRQQFIATAAESMRRILVDRARRRLAAKRGAGAERMELAEDAISTPGTDAQVLALHEALARFAAVDPKKSELVKLRYFVGLTFEEAAELLGVSVPTVNRWWAFSRAWLVAEMRDGSIGETLS
jgi:RNA polymerase sigma factor (TIGR02999 family)